MAAARRASNGVATGACIWVGGTSCLAQTYIEESQFGEWWPLRQFILASRHPPEVSWWNDAVVSGSVFHRLNMTDRASIVHFFDVLRQQKSTSKAVKTIIFGARAKLVTGTEQDHLNLSENVSFFMELASEHLPNLKGVLHISSVAVNDHTKPQSMLNEGSALPAMGEYISPYDEMKRCTEVSIEEACGRYGLISVQLRISGIFSNEKGHNCVQMSAFRLQSFVSVGGVDLDMNTSYNVCHAIRLIIARIEVSKSRRSDSPTDAKEIERLNPVYYYTRPTIGPRPYTAYLSDYRKANNCLGFNIWGFIGRPFLYGAIYCLEKISRLDRNRSHVFGNIAYLLKVGAFEHTFDNSLIRRDFPSLASLEERVLEGFIRIKARRRQDKRSMY